MATSTNENIVPAAELRRSHLHHYIRILEPHRVSGTLVGYTQREHETVLRLRVWNDPVREVKIPVPPAQELEVLSPA